MNKKESIRYISTAILTIFAVVILLKYSLEYINCNQLNFTEEDSFILFLVAFLFLCVIIVAVYLNYRLHRIIYLIKQFEEEVADMEDNLIETNNTQYYTIIGMLDKIARG